MGNRAKYGEGNGRRGSGWEGWECVGVREKKRGIERVNGKPVEKKEGINSVLGYDSALLRLYWAGDNLG